MNKVGSIDVICGSMFSGKTFEFLRKMEREVLAQKKTIAFKPVINQRDGENVITDRNKNFVIDAYNIPESYDKDIVLNIIQRCEEYDIVGFDEIQFFGVWIVDVCKTLRNNGKKVIVNGLDMDYRAEPFLTTSKLMAICDNVTKLHAVCTECGRDALFNQRLINGQPAENEGDKPVIGDRSKTKESPYTYQARCLTCYVHPNQV